MTTSFKVVISISLLITVLSIVSLIFLESAVNAPTEKPRIRVDEAIRVAVLNGCGRTGLASMFADRLRADGFDVVNGMGGNADSFDYDISVVIERKSGADKKAETVARALDIEETIIQHSDDPYIIEDVVVILGRDWNTLLYSKEDSTD